MEEKQIVQYEEESYIIDSGLPTLDFDTDFNNDVDFTELRLF